MSNEPKLRKNMFLLILLVMAGSIIYMLPYFRSYYYDAFKAAFNMNNTEIGRCGTYYGLFGAVSYLVGGYIADKISFKLLVPGSLIVTGALGLYLLTIPSPFAVAVVHGIWGITSLMTFWPALVKALRAVGNQNEQGRVFGIFEGGRGVVNGVVYAIAAAVFAAFMSEVNPFSGIAQLLIMYSVLPIVLGILLIFALRNVDNVHGEDESGKINFKLIATALKNPGIWLAIMICQDGFITSHAIENIELEETEAVRKFVGEYKPQHYLLNKDEPIAVGPYSTPVYYMETKRAQAQATRYTASNRYATGYTVSASYTGEVSKPNCAVVTYTTIFGSEKAPDESKAPGGDEDHGPG